MYYFCFEVFVFEYFFVHSSNEFKFSNIFSNSHLFQDPVSGIIPRALSHMFDELRLLQVEHTVRTSFLELYNEEIFDLLSCSEEPSHKSLR